MNFAPEIGMEHHLQFKPGDDDQPESSRLCQQQEQPTSGLHTGTRRRRGMPEPGQCNQELEEYLSQQLPPQEQPVHETRLMNPQEPSRKKLKRKGKAEIPAGFKFRPTDLELLHYLKMQVEGKLKSQHLFHFFDFYEEDPAKLIEKHHNGREKEVYIFSHRDRKYANGNRPRRSTPRGFWKATAAYVDIIGKDGLVDGMKRSLCFYTGEHKASMKTDILMQEYVISSSHRPPGQGNNKMMLDSWVLCKLYRRQQDELKKEGEHNQPCGEVALDDSTSLPMSSNNFVPSLDFFHHHEGNHHRLNHSANNIEGQPPYPTNQQADNRVLARYMHCDKFLSGDYHQALMMGGENPFSCNENDAQVELFHSLENGPEGSQNIVKSASLPGDCSYLSGFCGHPQPTMNNFTEEPRHCANVPSSAPVGPSRCYSYLANPIRMKYPTETFVPSFSRHMETPQQDPYNITMIPPDTVGHDNVSHGDNLGHGNWNYSKSRTTSSQAYDSSFGANPNATNGQEDDEFTNILNSFVIDNSLEDLSTFFPDGGAGGDCLGEQPNIMADYLVHQDGLQPWGPTTSNAPDEHVPKEYILHQEPRTMEATDIHGQGTSSYDARHISSISASTSLDSIVSTMFQTQTSRHYSETYQQGMPSSSNVTVEAAPMDPLLPLSALDHLPPPNFPLVGRVDTQGMPSALHQASRSDHAPRWGNHGLALHPTPP